MRTPDEIIAHLEAEIENDPEAERLESEPGSVAVYDADYGRVITFHVVPRTADELAKIIYLGPSLGDEDQRARWTHDIAGVLTRLDPTVLMTLNRVLVVGTAEDCEAFATTTGVFEELPDNLFDEDVETGLNPSAVGIHWFLESTAIVNVDAIRRCAFELYPEDDEEYAREREVRIGFWTTLLHEIRHNQADASPYELPWLDDAMTAESAVEAWAIETFEKLKI